MRPCKKVKTPPTPRPLIFLGRAKWNLYYSNE